MIHDYGNEAAILCLWGKRSFENQDKTWNDVVGTCGRRRRRMECHWTECAIGLTFCFPMIPTILFRPRLGIVFL